MPTRRGHGHGPREELVPEGLFWRPQGHSSSGWHFVRPSRAHRRGHRRTTSLRDPFPQAFPSNLHTSYNPDLAELMQWQFPSPGVTRFDDSCYEDDMRWQAAQHGVSPFDDPGDRAQFHHRAVAWSRSFQQTSYAVEYQEEYYAVERAHRNGHSRSVSAPQNSLTPANHGEEATQSSTPSSDHGDEALQRTITDPDHDEDVAARYPQIPEHVREHPRFEEVAHAAEMIKKFGEGDPRAEFYKKLVKEITDGINKDTGEG